MSQLIVIKFDDMEQAGKVRGALREQEKHGLIKMEDAEVIVRDADGKIEKKRARPIAVSRSAQSVAACRSSCWGWSSSRSAGCSLAPRPGPDRQIARAGCR